MFLLTSDDKQVLTVIDTGLHLKTVDWVFGIRDASAVTLADIQDAAQKYLDLKRSVTGQLIPVNKALASRGKVSVPGPSDTIH